MRLLIFVLFVAMPFVEIALLIKLGGLLGFWPTIAIVLATGMTGAYVLHSQGLATLHRVSQSLAAGEPPLKPMVDGFFLAISGAFLLTPGIVTDAIGLLLLIPPARHLLARWAFSRALRHGSFTIHTSGEQRQESPGPFTAPPRQPPRHPQPKSAGPGIGPVIDTDYEEVKKR